MRKMLFVTRQPGSNNCDDMYQPGAQDRLNFRMVYSIVRDRHMACTIELWEVQEDEEGVQRGMHFVNVLREDPSWRA